MENVAQKTEKTITGAIKINEKGIQDHLDGVVRQTVEDVLNELLNAEADAICQAGRYQHPGVAEKITVDEKNIYSIPEDFKDWGIYLAEQREE